MTSTVIKTNICIIGAGPAGAAASIFLSRFGIDHVIVDAAAFPRHKVCGDGLDLKTVRMLNHIDPAIVQHELLLHPHFAASWGARTITPKGKLRDLVYHPPKGNENQCPFFVAKRFHFDEFLVKKIDPAFASLYQETKVTKMERDGNQWKVFAVNKGSELQIETKLIIGADGDHSVLLRHLGERKIDRTHYAGAVRQYWKNVEGIHDKNLLEIYYPKDLPLSYFWLFPLPNGEANVGYGMVSGTASKYNVNIRAKFKEMIQEDEAIAYRFRNAEAIGEPEGWGLPLASVKRKLAGDGWLLAGDAGSLISPANGEGIGSAMLTGYIAAHFIKRAVEQHDFSANMFANYDREVYKRMLGEIREYNFYLHVNPAIKNWIFNNLLPDNAMMRYFFTQKMRSWIETAYEKKIEVNL